MDFNKVQAIKQAVKEWFMINKDFNEVPAFELMEYFIEKGIFKKDGDKKGLPIREVLRKLEDNELLSHLLPCVEYKTNGRTKWFFHSSKAVGNEAKSRYPKEDLNIKRLKPGRKRIASDESYVIDLCDEVIGAKALRQHRFPFLLGDKGPKGRQTKLPVDAYYPDFSLVIEYHERQHSEPVPIFDKKRTISGLSRGEQRKLYDIRRREILPLHGISVVEISFCYFTCDSRRKIKRDRVTDRAVIMEILTTNGIRFTT